LFNVELLDQLFVFVSNGVPRITEPLAVEPV